MKMLTNRIFPLRLSVFAVMLLFSQCSSNKQETETKNTPSVTPNTPTVMVTFPEARDFEGELEIIATAKPNQVVKLYAMVGGYLQSIKVDIGDFVRQGRVLAVLKNPELVQQKEKAEADYQMKKTVYERLAAIYDNTPDLTPVQEVEKSKAEFESSRAVLAAINEQLGFLRVRAPFSGVVTARYVDKGALLQNGINNSSAMPLVEIMDISVVRIEVDVPETDVPLIGSRTPVDISFSELPFANYSGGISRISNALNPGTRTMKVQIDVENPDNKIKPGMNAKVKLKLSVHQGALSVPNIALSTAKGQTFIYRVVDGIVQKMNVKTGFSNKDFTEILDPDLKNTDKVIIQGKEMVSEGIKVIEKTEGDNVSK